MLRPHSSFLHTKVYARCSCQDCCITLTLKGAFAMDDHNTAQAIDALSARVTAIEGALIALAPRDEQDRLRALAVYDAFEKRILDGYNALPVPESFLALLRQSFSDIRALIDSTNVLESRNEKTVSGRGTTGE